MPVTVSKVGHVVLRVKDLDRSLSFYSGLLGLREVARRDFGEGPMVFLSSGHSHHDLALVQTGTLIGPSGAGLHHVALKIGGSLQELADAQRTLAEQDLAVHMTLDHRVSQGLYISDPDGNLVELYVDADEELWRQDPTLVANSDPITL